MKGLVPENNLRLAPMSGEEYLRMLRRYGKSEECGPIGSQYAELLAASNPAAGALSLVTCESRIGAISYGLHELPRGGISAQLDTVVVHPDVRRAGLGASLMTQLFDRLLHEFGEELHRISTIAVHPAVVRFLDGLGFEAGRASIPMHWVDLEAPEERERFERANRKQMRKRLQLLETRCLSCQHKAWGEVWCSPSGPVGGQSVAPGRLST
jgi:GNAT superfamily N-acetyltransferase